MRILTFLILLLAPLLVYSQNTQGYVEKQNQVINNNHSAGAGANAAKTSQESLSAGSDGWLEPTYSTSKGYGTLKVRRSNVVNTDKLAEAFEKARAEHAQPQLSPEEAKKQMKLNDSRYQERISYISSGQERKSIDESVNNEDNFIDIPKAQNDDIVTNNKISGKELADIFNRPTQNRIVEEKNVDEETSVDKSACVEYKEELENDLIAVDENDELVEEDVFVEYGIEFIENEEYTRKAGNTFYAGEPVSLLDNASVNDEDYIMWSEVVQSEDCVIKEIKNVAPHEYDVRVVTEVPYEYIADNEEEVYVEAGNTMLILHADNNVSQGGTMSDSVWNTINRGNVNDSIHEEDYLNCGDRIFFKENNRIMELKEEAELFMELSQNDFDLYQHTDSTFFLAAHEYGLAIVNDVNINNHSYDELVKVPIILTKIISNGDMTLISTPYEIIHYVDSGNLQLFWRSDAVINDMCFSSDGILIATDEAIFMCESEENSYVYWQGGADNVYATQDCVYARTEKGMICITKK